MLANDKLFSSKQKIEYLINLGILFFLCTTIVQAHQATLTWDVSTEPTTMGHRVYYGQTSGNYTSNVDVGLNTMHSIPNLLDGTYYFAVTSYNFDKIEGGFSNEVSKNFTTTTPRLPSPWLNMDIGNVGLMGNAGFADKTYTLSGSGADIWGATDAFHFAYQPLNGNGTIIARVVSITNTHIAAKAGVMIRENLDANTPYAMVLVTPKKDLIFQRRLTTGASSSANTVASIGIPRWVKLVRTGNVFRGYQSADGKKWIAIGGAVTINMATSVYIGLAVTSHNDNALNTVKLDNVIVQ